jgi:hypothetical protein
MPRLWHDLDHKKEDPSSWCAWPGLAGRFCGVQAGGLDGKTCMQRPTLMPSKL